MKKSFEPRMLIFQYAMLAFASVPLYNFLQGVFFGIFPINYPSVSKLLGESFINTALLFEIFFSAVVSSTLISIGIKKLLPYDKIGFILFVAVSSIIVVFRGLEFSFLSLPMKFFETMGYIIPLYMVVYCNECGTEPLK